MSALFCLEIVLDDCVRSGFKPSALARRILRDATTLASVGLCYGFLVRYLESIGNDLDDFLANPEIWQLEFGRIASERGLHVQGPDPSTIVASDRRTWTPHQVAMYQIVVAMQADCTERLAQIRDVGHRLVEAGGGPAAPPQILQWAASLDWNNYSYRKEENRLIFSVTPPDDVSAALAPTQVRLLQQEEMYRLINRYRPRRLTPYQFALAEPPSDEDLARDLAIARGLPQALPDEYPRALSSAMAGVAASTIQRAACSPQSAIPSEDFTWALSLLISVASRSRLTGRQIDHSLDFDGPDRIAALALPWVFAGPDDDGATHSEPDAEVTLLLDALENALCGCTCSSSAEVRANVAQALRAVYSRPCEKIDTRCWHEWIWNAIEAGCRNVLLGPWHEGYREVITVSGDVSNALNIAQGDSLIVDYVAPAAVCVLDASTSTACLRDRALGVRGPILEAYAKAEQHRATHHYEWRRERQTAFGSALLRCAEHEGSTFLLKTVRRLRGSVGALAELYDGLITAATYEPQFVLLLGKVWPTLMSIGLDASTKQGGRTEHFRRDKLLSNLIPSPKPFGFFEDADSVVATARSKWFSLGIVQEHIGRWLEIAKENMFAVDSLIGFLEAQTIQDQANVGLEWVHRLIVEDDGSASSCGFLLVRWLRDLRASQLLTPEGLRLYRSVVDALVLGNFSGARDLQRLDE